MEFRDNEINILNRSKVAYLYTNGIYEERIEKVTRHGVEQYGFVYLKTGVVADLLKKFDEDNFLKMYNSNFKQIAVALAKVKSRE